MSRYNRPNFALSYVAQNTPMDSFDMQSPTKDKQITNYICDDDNGGGDDDIYQ